MRKKKGFTLIELLAVIVILAIIALITVPVVIKIINNSKKGAAEDSAYGVVEAAKLFWMSNQVDFVNNNEEVTFTCKPNKTCTTVMAGSSETMLDLTGTKPTGGTVKIKNGAISVTNLKFGEYYCNKTKLEEKIVCGTSEVESEPEDLTYIISFETDGGTIMLPKVVEPGQTLGNVSNPRKIGYTFTGWLDENSNPVTSTTLITSDITLYAQYEIKNVTVTFNSDGGSSVDSITFQEGSMIDPLPETTKAGNNFLGWFNGQEQLTTSKMIMNDTTYIAHWEERTVTVTFNSDGGSSVSPRTIPEGSTISDLPTSTKLGYTLSAWKNGSNTLTTSTVINADITYTAEWAVKNVTVTFNSDGGSSVSSQTVQEGSTINPLPTTTKSGNEFLGWYDSSDNQLTTSTIINNDITYIAKWHNQLAAYSNSGHVIYYDPVSTTTCDASTFNLDNVKNGTSTCYRWRTIKDDANTMTMQLDHNLLSNVGWENISTNITTAMQNMATATSTWTRVPALTYSYDSTAASTNYGILSCTNGTCTINGTTINNVKARLIEGEEVANITRTQTNGNTTADNFTIASDNYFYFSSTGKTVGGQTGGTGNKNLSWLIENTKTDSSSGATNDSYSNNTSKGYLTLSPRSARNNFYLVYYEGFLGYYSNGESGIGARPVIKVQKSANNITFNYNDGVTSNLVRSYKLFDKLGQLPTPNQRENYTFKGWNTKQNGTGIYVDENTIVNFNILYAIWQDNRVQDFIYNTSNPSPEKYTASYTGTYRLEVWGAQGGNASDVYQGGRGGYSTGTITLNQGDELYVVVGGQGVGCYSVSTCPGGYNGGGNGYVYSGTVGSGGGATHIGTFNSTLLSHNSNTGLYIVAAGGGGSMNNSDNLSYANGGYAGGLIGGVVQGTSGKSHKNDGTGGTQTQGGTYSLYYNSSFSGLSTSSSNGKFGAGGTYSTTNSDVFVAGGGSGYYGGGVGYLTGGTGGSSYIDGVNNGSTIDGEHEMPSPLGGTEIGHSGNGYARITYLGN